MSKLIFILSLMAAYVFGLHKFSDRALAATQQMAGFYTAAGDPASLLATASK